MSGKLRDLVAELEKTASPAVIPEVVAPVSETKTETPEMEATKMAELLSAQGSIFGQAVVDTFIAGLQKQAVAPVGMTANPGAVAPTPAAVSREQADPQLASTIAGLIAKLTHGERLAPPTGYVQVNGNIVQEGITREASVKTSAERIVGGLYNYYFGGTN